MVKPAQMESFAVILPAAGRSVRFGGPRSKLLERLNCVPVIRRAVDAFLARDDVSLVVVATSADQKPHEVLGASPTERLDSRLRFTPGGANRAQSVLAALREVPREIIWVAVHDAARPLVSQELISRTLKAANEHGAAVPALPISLTVKQADGPLPAKVQRTLSRHTLWSMQTPQIMRRADLLEAFEHCPLPLEQITDDVQVLELANKDVWLVEGEERNLKITTPLDLRTAELLLEQSS